MLMAFRPKRRNLRHLLLVGLVTSGELVTKIRRFLGLWPVTENADSAILCSSEGGWAWSRTVGIYSILGTFHRRFVFSFWVEVEVRGTILKKKVFAASRAKPQTFNKQTTVAKPILS